MDDVHQDIYVSAFGLLANQTFVSPLFFVFTKIFPLNKRRDSYSKDIDLL